MNLCQFCGQPATIHLTDIIQKQKKESHLCEACAREKQLIPDGPAPQLNLTALVEMIVGGGASGAVVRGDDATPPLVCAKCGTKYADFRASGRFGCPRDYDAFQEELRPLLERVHRSVVHCGKVPRRESVRIELDRLQSELQEAVQGERYEEAARLRDDIRRKEGVG